MKKVLLIMAGIAMILTSCSDDSNELNNQQQQIDMSDFYTYTADADEASRQAQSKDVKSCNTMINLNNKLSQNPGLEKKMYDIEYHIRSVIAGKKGGNGGGNGNGGGPGGGGGGNTPTPYEGTINIPVVVHVLFNTTEENISQAQIDSQIDALNAAFDGSDADNNFVPTEFEPAKAGNVDINFTLTHVSRTFTTRTSWPYTTTNDYMKSSSTGGVDPWDTKEYLNIWVVSQMPYSSGRILGYAQFPGGSADTDGVVMDYNDFGTTGAAVAPNDLGKVTSHEVGHWLNLRHIWGDGRCKQDDFVADTPESDRSNRGCPTYPLVHCRSADMTMNYMDYTDDACLYMFTKGQADRMRALFATGGAREDFVLP